MLGCSSKKSLKLPKQNKTYYFNEFYLPSDSFLTTQFNQKRDSSIASFYSKLLVSLSEPNLYNYAGDAEVYRLTIDRTFSNYFCIRMVKLNNEIKYTYKETAGIGSYFLDDLKKVNEKKIPKDKWKNYKKLLEEYEFWEIQTDIDTIPEGDGESWLFEAKTKNKYHCILRIHPNENKGIYEIGTMMMELKNKLK